ncbi:tellurite resistance TerB family protein [Actinomadura macrotermitis]|uniref:Co-chaperone DjlA N-terminal domain-containing protein n=1 Tax=Actinomadura macrotermitis TaxID=2585200 RepID=A0A7K0BPT5_9ACTN|nr:TerB family tellurite resistance protein [Actinomadura macrotermitis]MQY03209.1 hypothetical protein [Actinomadura macrotermitis]
MDTREKGALWLFKKDWSFDSKPSIDDFEAYAKALMICAKGDGVIAPAEREWIVGYFAAFGCTDGLAEKLEEYQAGDTLQDVLSGSQAANACSRGIIHDAVRACAADGVLHEDELASIRTMNRLFGHPDELVDQWVEFHRDEERMRARRAALVWPDPKDKPF